MEKTCIIFLSVPSSLKEDLRQFSHNGGIDFEVDSSVLLPVEFNSSASLDPADLSWEMILSGMLKLISESVKAGKKTAAKNIEPGYVIRDTGEETVPDEWINYYRGFVFSVKPEIFHEFTNASIVKAGNGEYDMALEISAVLEGLFPGSPGVLLNKALICEKKAEAFEKAGRDAGKEKEEALNAYETALSIKAVLPDTYFNAGFFFMQRNEFSRAKECFSEYVSKSAEDEFSSEGSNEKIKRAQKIIGVINAQGLDDEDLEEAYSLISGGNDENGLVKAGEFIENHPKVWNGWFLLGWALRKLGRYKDSLEAFIKAAELGGGGSDIQNETAICLMELGDLKGAKLELEKALSAEPENVKVISNMGVLALKTGNKEQAAAFFRTVLELDPNDPLAKHFLEP